MNFEYNDGGRSKYFKASNVGDCVTRAIVNATGKDYLEVYKKLQELERTMRVGRHEHKGSVRNGTRKRVSRYYIENELGWVWVPCMGIGTGCQVHVRDGELPKETIILNLSGHLSCSRNGDTIVDTYDCSRDGDRCVYGYWRAPTTKEAQDRIRQQEIISNIQDKKKELEKTINTKIEEIVARHKPTINKLKKKLKEYKHQLVLEENRIKREIKKAKDESR